MRREPPSDLEVGLAILGLFIYTIAGLIVLFGDYRDHPILLLLSVALTVCTFTTRAHTYGRARKRRAKAKAGVGNV